jgi:hypothetical protein
MGKAYPSSTFMSPREMKTSRSALDAEAFACFLLESATPLADMSPTEAVTVCFLY